VAWTAFNQSSPAFISDTPPPNPAVGQMWWRGTNGKFYMWVDDGNSKQWVEIGNAGATPGAWEPIYLGTFTCTSVAPFTNAALLALGVYQKLRITADFKPGANDDGFNCQFSSDGGATWNVTSGDYVNTLMRYQQIPSNV